MNQENLHLSITADRVIAAAEQSMFSLSNPGICTACGADYEGCEPDARGYECPECHGRTVVGAEELLIYFA